MKLLPLAQLAPSNSNIQPWRMVFEAEKHLGSRRPPIVFKIPDFFSQLIFSQ